MKRSTEVLRGEESLRLSTFCSNTHMMSTCDLDDEYGRFFISRDVSIVFLLDYTKCVYDEPETLSADAKMVVIAQDLFELRWGPTLVPLYDEPWVCFHRQCQNVDKTTLSLQDSTSSLSKSPSMDRHYSAFVLFLDQTTKPSVDLEYAQMLYDADGDINNRNR